MDTEETPGISLEDRIGVARLKYLRNRTLMKSKKRDSAYLLKMVTPKEDRWNANGPLMPVLTELHQAIGDYDAAGADPDVLWLHVLDAVNAVIREAERLTGHRIEPSPT